MPRPFVPLVLGVCLLGAPATASAQRNLQLWGNVTLDWIASDRIVYEVDFEPKAMVAAPSGSSSWRSLDVTPSIEFAAKNWLDLTGELNTGFTHETDDLRSTELTGRFGARFHVFSRRLPTPITGMRPNKKHRMPKRRFVIRDYVRVESRNLFYSDDTPTSSTVRFRNRLEVLTPLNRDSLAEDRTRYFMADWEWFVPLDDPAERFANKQRIRAGIGYRHNAAWKLETLYIWSRSRNTVEEGFTTSDHIIDIRFKMVF